MKESRKRPRRMAAYMAKGSPREKLPFGEVLVGVGEEGIPDDVKVVPPSRLAREPQKSESDAPLHGVLGMLLQVAIAQVRHFSPPRLQSQSAKGADLVLSPEQRTSCSAQLSPRDWIGQSVPAFQVKFSHLCTDLSQLLLLLPGEYLLLPERNKSLGVTFFAEGNQVCWKVQPFVAHIHKLAQVPRDDLVNLQEVEVTFAAVSTTSAIPLDDLQSQLPFHARHLPGNLSVHVFRDMFKTVSKVRHGSVVPQGRRRPGNGDSSRQDRSLLPTSPATP